MNNGNESMKKSKKNVRTRNNNRNTLERKNE